MSADPLLERLRAGGAVPRHVAIIMDGNGRWAKERHLPRTLGHREGMKAVREIVEGAIEAGIEALTLFAFSEENWRRPAVEIGALMGLLEEYIARETRELRANGVEVHVFGDLARLSQAARDAIDQLVAGTRGGTTLLLNLAISYSSRAEIARAARRLAEDVRQGRLALEDVDEEALGLRLYTAGLPDPDLLIRTSGELRISNFLLWQLAYTELHITPVLWPDFPRRHLFEAVIDFQGRERRFGRVTA
ncbi:MAG: di-trans,poly-cis-decaprenylcistransferase [Gemmatimonadetes bacterium RIFCSPLOWO2_02_FULL_71_11]|nr:MAG: di-trans,poly-cis-decaprenylcistransferase [Gemmatimonadetes bacterium RIFCSPLOWO2_02_FULL_71_11]